MQRTPISRRQRPSKSPLSREAIVKVALSLVKRGGLEKVTMRRIAAALETGPASLYVYVRNTRDLHRQVLDALINDVPAPKPGPAWRTDVLVVAEALLTALMRYPEIALMTLSTPATGPSSMRLFDTLTGLLLEGGAEGRAAAWGVHQIVTYVTATAIEHGGEDRSDESDFDELRQMISTLDATTHSHLATVGGELISGEGLQRFRWGLSVLVTGILRTPSPLVKGQSGER